MFLSRARLLLAIVLALIPLLLAACFRDTSESFDTQPVAQEQVTEAPAEVIEPTAQPVATEEPTSAEPPADEFALSATALIAQQTQAAESPLILTQASAPVLAPLTRATIPPGEDCVHEIRIGDTLFQLSLAYGVSVGAISAASGITNPDVISVGQKITIPECGTLGFIPPPTSIPTATLDPNRVLPTAAPDEQEVVAAGNQRNALVEQAQSVLLNNAQAGAAFSVQAVPQASGRTYTVQPNDTLLLIALRFGTTLDALAALNNIADVDSLDAGQELQLP